MYTSWVSHTYISIEACYNKVFFQDCDFNMVYHSCPGGDPRPLSLRTGIVTLSNFNKKTRNAAELMTSALFCIGPFYFVYLPLFNLWFFCFFFVYNNNEFFSYCCFFKINYPHFFVLWLKLNTSLLFYNVNTVWLLLSKIPPIWNLRKASFY